MGSVENVTELLNCYDVDQNALLTNTSIIGFGSESEWILGIGNFFWFFGFVIIDQSNWQVKNNILMGHFMMIASLVHSGVKARFWSCRIYSCWSDLDGS